MKRILVIQTASIGDVILATALLESLHRTSPGAKIDLLLKKGNDPLFSGHPFLHEVLVWDKQRRKYRNLIHLIRRIRKNRYDLVINIQRFLSTGLITACSGAKETIGFAKNPLSRFFTRRVEHRIGSNLHEVERNQALIEGISPGGELNPRLYPRPEDEAMVSQWMPGLYYTISPASLWFTKQYPADCWAELIRSVPSGTPVYLLGSPDDRDLCQRITDASGHPLAVNLAGRLTFLQSAALMRSARMNFTNDSAPMHLAAAVDARVTAVFCSTIPGFGFGPRSTDALIAEISFHLPCRPCGLHGLKSCPEGHFRCAYGIDKTLLTGRL